MNVNDLVEVLKNLAAEDAYKGDYTKVHSTADIIDALKAFEAESQGDKMKEESEVEE